MTHSPTLLEITHRHVGYIRVLVSPQRQAMP